MSPDEFDLFSTYLYLFGNKRVKYKLSFFRIFLMPVSSQDLASALIAALESNTVSPVSAPNDIVFDILLAEDNLVNQKLAVKILEKYGHSVEIAENGSLAVDAFKTRVQRNQPFNIILVGISLL